MSQPTKIDGNPATVQVVCAGGKVYQRHNNGQIWRYNGPYASPHWAWVSGNDNLQSIAATAKHLYKLRTNGEILRYNEGSRSFDLIRKVDNIKGLVASEKSFYYVLDGHPAGIGLQPLDDPCESYEELKQLYDASKDREAHDQAQITQLEGVKTANERMIHQLEGDYTAAQGQVSTLTAQLNTLREQSAKKEKDMQAQIASLQKSLATAEVVEKKLTQDLNEEKKKEVEELKKAQEHDAEDHKVIDATHKALEQAQAQNVELEKHVDQLTRDVDAKRVVIKNLEAKLAETVRKEELAEAELKKHLTDDEGENLVIAGLEKVIDGLKKEIKGQEILIGVMRKQLAKQDIVP
jgi:hypothetical protein